MESEKDKVTMIEMINLGFTMIDLTFRGHSTPVSIGLFQSFEIRQPDNKVAKLITVLQKSDSGSGTGGGGGR